MSYRVVVERRSGLNGLAMEMTVTKARAVASSHLLDPEAVKVEILEHGTPIARWVRERDVWQGGELRS